MIPIRSGVHVRIATAHTDMCRGLLQIHQLCRDILGLFLAALDALGRGMMTNANSSRSAPDATVKNLGQ
jgi:hypothetical protein